MQRHLTRPSLADVMVREGILPRRTVDQVVARLGGNTTALGQTLVEEGTISEAQLAQALASQYGLPYDPLTAFRVDSEFYHTISVKLMRRHPFVPVKDEAGVLTIAISDPQNLLALDELEILLNRTLHYVVSSRSAIQSALERSEGSSQALRELEAEYRSVLVKEDERGEEVLTVDHFGEDQNPVVKLLDTILLSAMQRRASDIHIEATDRATTVKFRVDGILVSAMDPLDVKSASAPRVSPEGHVRPRHRRASGAARWKFQDAARSQNRRFSRLDSAERFRRIRGHQNSGPRSDHHGGLHPASGSAGVQS